MRENRSCFYCQGKRIRLNSFLTGLLIKIENGTGNMGFPYHFMLERYSVRQKAISPYGMPGFPTVVPEVISVPL